VSMGSNLSMDMSHLKDVAFLDLVSFPETLEHFLKDLGLLLYSRNFLRSFRSVVGFVPCIVSGHYFHELVGFL